MPWLSLFGVAVAAPAASAGTPAVAGWDYQIYGGRVLPPDRTVYMVAEVAPGYGLGTEILEHPFGSNGGAVGHHGSGSGYVTVLTGSGYVTVLTVAPADHLSIAVLAVGSDQSGLRPGRQRHIAAMHIK